MLLSSPPPMTFCFVLESDLATFLLKPTGTFSRIPSGNPCFWQFGASGRTVQKFELQELNQEI